MKSMSWLKTPLHYARLAALVLTAGTTFHAVAADTIAANTLTIGSDLTYPPYDYMESNQPAGFDAAFMGKLASQLKLKTHYVDTRFANLIVGVNALRFDVIASALYITPERSQQIDFVPYFKTGGSLLVLSKSGFAPKTPEDLCGKRVGSIKGASWIPKLNDVSQRVCLPTGRGKIDVREFETSPEAAQALMAHAVDAQFEDSAVSKIMADKLGGRAVITSTTPLYPVVVGLGVKKGNDALLAKLSSAVASMKQSGAYAALLKQYNVAEPSAAEIAAATGVVQK